MMDNDIMKEQGLRDIYYSPKSGFQTPEKLYLRAISDGLEVNRSQVKKWINEQDTYTRYRQVFRRHKFRQTYSTAQNEPNTAVAVVLRLACGYRAVNVRLACG
jgi:hypothetical protein